MQEGTETKNYLRHSRTKMTPAWCGRTKGIQTMPELINHTAGVFLSLSCSDANKKSILHRTDEKYSVLVARYRNDSHCIKCPH